MRKYIRLLIVLIFAFQNKSQAYFTYAQTEAKAKSVLDLFVAKKFADIEKQVDTLYQSYYSATTFERDWAELTGTYGEFLSAKPVNFEANEFYNFIGFKIEFAYLPYIFNISFNNKGEIIYVSFMQAHNIYVAPDYCDVSKFLERKLTVNNGFYEMPGLLTVPNNQSKSPLVIILAEAGPTDKDGSFEENRPYKDIAWGLASMGYAVYRYEKRSNNYGIYMLRDKGAYETFTPREDLLNDLYKAIDTLKTLPDIDPSRIYVLGHGQGGMLLPLVAKERREVKGIVLMGATAKRQQENMIDQYKYLTKVTPYKKAEYDEQTINAKRSMDKNLKPLTEHKFMPYGVQATYWIWLNQYKQVEIAQKLKKPILILHGNRDYQTNMEDLGIWRKALKNNPFGTVKDYPKLNHLFYSGDIESTYSEYFIRGNIPEYVIKDIYTWLNNSQDLSK
ncbi:MAG: dienelactone hydrolase family protein [bacterium]|nr:dienelactone hydrolase family protein [bacterium]